MRIICICNAVSEPEIKAAIVAGARSVEDVAAACSAGDDCGSCQDYIEEMIEDYCKQLTITKENK
jgi:bacterioferritin-associated ferredoxin